MSVSSVGRLIKVVMICDFVFLILVYLGNFSFRFKVNFTSALHEPFVYLVAIISLSCLYTFGAYDLDSEDGILPVVLRQIVAELVSSMIVVALIYFSRADVAGVLGRGVLLGSFVTFFVPSLLLKFLGLQFLKFLRDSWSWLVIGSDVLIERLNKDMSSGSHFGYVEHLIQNQDNLHVDIASIMKKKWSGIIIATKAHLHPEVSQNLLHEKLKGLIVLDLVQVYEKFWEKIPVFFLEDRWFLTINGFGISSSKVGLRMKRLFDISISLLTLLIAWPIMLAAYFWIKFDSHGPAIFRQTRTGKDGSEFQIFKFRSMYIDAEKDGAKWAQANDSRVTPVGKYLRLFRIDELPQVFNVLNGDMSFIGPRPERPEFNTMLEEQIPYYQLRHLVRPGITGWAQVQYPYGASIEDAIEKLQYDLYYIKNYSFLLDLKILLKTIKVIVFGKGR